MKFNVFNNFNRLSHFNNREMLIFPNGIYRKAQENLVEYLKLITPFNNEEQYFQALEGLTKEDKAQMQGIKDVDPSSAFQIANLSINSLRQNTIFNTALFLLQTPNMHGKTFKIDLFARLNDEGRINTVAYVPKQFAYTDEDKKLKKLKNDYYLLAEYYFSDEEVDNHLLQRRKIDSPHFLVVCEYFSENKYSLTKDAKYYATYFDSNSVSNMNIVLDSDIRDKYFLNMRGTLDKEIRRLVNTKWDGTNNSLVKYTVNPDVILSGGFDSNIKTLDSYKNIILKDDEEIDTTVEKDDYMEKSSKPKESDFIEPDEEITDAEELPEQNLTKKDDSKKTEKVEKVVKFPPLNKKNNHSQIDKKDKPSKKEETNDEQEKVENVNKDKGINNKVSSFFGDGKVSKDDDEEESGSLMDEWSKKGNYDDM